jgi:signal transduction histidine kinase
MSSKATGLRFSSNSPESAVTKISRWIALFRLRPARIAIRRFLQSLRQSKGTKGGLPLLRVHPIARWATHDEERRELSRELHDSVGPLLTAVGLHLRTLRLSSPMPPELNTQLEEVSSLNAEALRMIRDLAMGIRPALLDDVNLAVALESQARQFSRRVGIAASVKADAALDHLPEDHRACIYRCVTEALTNCAKHSHAKNIRIVVSLSAESVSVQVEDDGIGIAPSRFRMGLGLLGMRERVSRLHGTLSIVPGPQGGTSITLEIPMSGSVLV